METADVEHLSLDIGENTELTVFIDAWTKSAMIAFAQLIY